MGIVPKTEKEILLNDIYMRWLKSDSVIPKSIVNRFKMDCDEIRKENKLYKDKN
jgi:hypothetical protein